jgi:hypothetical protein
MPRLGLAETRLQDSVANWQKFRLQNTKKWPHKNVSGRKNPRSNECMRTFLNCIFHRKDFIVSRKTLSSTLMNSSFFYYFAAEIFLKQVLWKDNVCGLIFSQAVEFFDCYGPNHQRYYSKDVATFLNDDIFLVFVCWKRGASQGVQGATIVYIS